MASTANGKGVKATLTALAIFIAGLGITALQTGNMYVAVALFVITAILGFFVAVIETPAKNLPPELQALQKQIESVSNSKDLISLLNKYSPQIETAIQTLVTEAEKNNISLQDVVKQITANLPAIVQAVTKVSK